jgi:O-antigen/teichoic acid export membrane protein
VLAFATLPFLSRQYGPEVFGQWAMMMAAVMIIGSLSTLRYELAIVKERDAKFAAHLFWCGMLLGLVIVAIISMIVFFVVNFKYDWLYSRLEMALCAIWAVVIVVHQYLSGWALRHGRFGLNSQSIVVNTAITNAFHVGLGFASASSTSLIAGNMLGQMCATLVLATSFYQHKPTWPARGIADAIWVLRRHRRFVFFSMPYTALSMARERLPLFMLAAYMPAALLGQYSQAWRLVHLPVSLSGSALRPIVFHSAAEHGIASSEHTLRRLFALIIVIGTPTIGFFLTQPAAIFAFVLGPEWRQSGIYAALLVVPAFLFTLTNWLDRVLDVANRQDLNLKLELAVVLLFALPMAIGLSGGCNYEIAVAIQAVGLSVGYLLVLYHVHKACAFDMRPLLILLSKGLGIGMLTWVLVSIGITIAGPVWGLFTGGILWCSIVTMSLLGMRFGYI